jgi:hypothetical protein
MKPPGLYQGKGMVLTYLARCGNGLSKKQLKEYLGGVEGRSLVVTLARYRVTAGWKGGVH